MQVTWKGEDLGTFKGKSLTVQEMRYVKSQTPEYRNPMRLLRAAGAVGEEIAVIGPDGKPKFEDAVNADGTKRLGEDGKPVRVAVTEVVPVDDWDPDALAMFICLLMRRKGRTVNFEDIDGTLEDLDVMPDAEEIAAQAEADVRAGKAPATPTTPDDGEQPPPQE